MFYTLRAPRRDFWDGFLGYESTKDSSSFVEQTKEGQVIRLATPGVRKEDLETYIIGERLFVSYAGDKTHFRDPFKQTWLLPKGFDASTMTASYENGVLSINLPNSPKPETRRHNIPIQ